MKSRILTTYRKVGVVAGWSELVPSHNKENQGRHLQRCMGEKLQRYKGEKVQLYKGAQA